MGLIALSIAPIFLLICAGYGLRHTVLTSDAFWAQTDRLVYFILMPALFFVRMSQADLSDPALIPFAVTLYGGFFAAVAFGILAATRVAASGPVATSVIQGAGRFNTFIGLAAAEALFALSGLNLAVLAAALLVPVVNITIVGAFTRYVPHQGVSALRGAVVSLATNPLILSILAGVAVNLAGLGPVPVLDETLELLGQAALPIMLLCVGASLRLRGLSGGIAPIAAAALGKLVVFPTAILALALVLSLPPLAAQVALIYGALPTGAAAYALARQLGGDAPLMAAMITVQTLLAFAVLPLWLTLGARLLGL